MLPPKVVNRYFWKKLENKPNIFDSIEKLRKSDVIIDEKILQNYAEAFGIVE